MANKRNIKSVPINQSLAFQEKENCIYRGLLVYLGDTLGEFLSEEQLVLLAESLRRLRNRPADVEYSDDLCSLVSDESEIRNRYIPRKLLRKDEASVLFYNISPYALIGRKHTALLAKRAFPNFFASAATIYSTITKFTRMPGCTLDKTAGLSILPFSDHSIHGVETVLFNLGMKDQN